MIAVTSQKLMDVQRSQLGRHDLAVGSWGQGDIEGACILLESVLSEDMTPLVAARCFVSQAAFRAEAFDYKGSMESLTKAARFIDAADVRTQGAFYNQRARAYKELGNIDAALTDYAGASVCFEKAGDRDYQGAAVLNLAGLFLKLGDLNSAKTKVDQAIAVLTECESKYLPQAYDTLANIELAGGQIENAITAIGRALDLVGENETWRGTFLETKERISKKVHDVSGLLHTVTLNTVRRALIATEGNLTQAAKLTGLTHKGVAYIVDRHPELEQFRARRRTRSRLKSIIKK